MPVPPVVTDRPAADIDIALAVSVPADQADPAGGGAGGGKDGARGQGTDNTGSLTVGTVVLIGRVKLLSTNQIMSKMAYTECWVINP